MSNLQQYLVFGGILSTNVAYSLNLSQLALFMSIMVLFEINANVIGSFVAFGSNA